MKKLLLLFIFVLQFSSLTFAATFVVDNNGDTIDANTADNLCLDSNGNCTLRAAVEQANALAGDDTITFDLAASSPISLIISELPINTNITIVGTDASQITVQRSTVSGTPEFRIFNIAVVANVTITNLTVSGGTLDTIGGTVMGGGIYNEGILSITNCVISNNVAKGDNS